MFDSTISDNELRDLLRQVVLTGDENDSLTQKMIDMEQSAVFATTPLAAISVAKETAFLAQLKSGVAVKSALKLGLNMKWLFGGLGTVCVATTGLIAYNAMQEPANTPQGNKQTLIVSTPENSKDTSANFIATPYDTFGLNPTPPARENVTEQSPEVLLFAEETPIEFPAKGKRHMRSVAQTTRKLERLEAPMYANTSDFPEMPEPSELVEFADFNDDSLIPAVSFSNISRLEVDIDWGDIIITKSSDQQVHIKERGQQVGVEDKNGVLSVYIQPVTHRGEETPKPSRKEKKQCVTINSEMPPLEISLPDGTEILLHNSNGDISVRDLTMNKAEITADFGDINVNNLSASLQATASSGDVVISHMSGTTIARSYFGDLNVESVKGTTNVYTSSGNVTVNSIIGDLSLQSDFGDVTLRAVNGRTVINCNSGNISVDSISGSQLKVNSNFGDASIKHVTAPTELVINSGNLSVDETIGDLTVRSQFGEVTIDDVKGNLFVYGNSGNINLSDLDGNLIVESVFGNVDFSNTKGNVSITANSGNVDGKDVLVTEKLSVEVDFGNSDIELDNDANDLQFDVEATMGTASVSKGSLKLKKDEGHIVTEKGAITIKGVARSGSVSFD